MPRAPSAWLAATAARGPMVDRSTTHLTRLPCSRPSCAEMTCCTAGPSGRLRKMVAAASATSSALDRACAPSAPARASVAASRSNTSTAWPPCKRALNMGRPILPRPIKPKVCLLIMFSRLPERKKTGAWSARLKAGGLGNPGQPLLVGLNDLPQSIGAPLGGGRSLRCHLLQARLEFRAVDDSGQRLGQRRHHGLGCPLGRKDTVPDREVERWQAAFGKSRHVGHLRYAARRRQGNGLDALALMQL